jgi:hypothetical protein
LPIPFNELDNCYIIPWGSILTQRPPQPNGRCVQTSPEKGVLIGIPPQNLIYQKWIFSINNGDMYTVKSAEDPNWVLSHHSLSVDNAQGIYDGPISMSILKAPPSPWQLWRVIQASIYYNDARFPENVFLFLTNFTLIHDDIDYDSCMGLARIKFGRPQHLLEWRIKLANEEFDDKNQTFIVRRV